MLKMMQIYQNAFFGVFFVFFLFFGFFWKFIKNMGQKLGSNRCPLFTMLTKQKFLNVLHSKLVKKTKGLPGLLSDPLSQGLCFSKESGLIILGDLSILKKSGLFSRATCPHTHTGLFSRATFPHILTLVYFQGRPAHIYSLWSIFRGDRLTHLSYPLDSSTSRRPFLKQGIDFGVFVLWKRESTPSIMVTRKPNWSFRDSKARD